MFELFVAVRSNEAHDVLRWRGRKRAVRGDINGHFSAEDAVGEIDAANAGASVASTGADHEADSTAGGPGSVRAEMREYLLKAFKTTMMTARAAARWSRCAAGRCYLHDERCAVHGDAA